MNDNERRLTIALAMIIRYSYNTSREEDFENALENGALLLDTLGVNRRIDLPEFDDTWIDETNGDFYKDCIRDKDLKAHLVASCVLPNDKE